MDFDTVDTFLNACSHKHWRTELSGDLPVWLKSRMIKINRRLSKLSGRLTTREVKRSARQG
jgi:hypothetical protein